jgi:hypothetical protein
MNGTARYVLYNYGDQSVENGFDLNWTNLRGG